MSGGQFLVNLANSIVFEYSNKGVQVVSPNLTVSFVQPLLRGLGPASSPRASRFRNGQCSTTCARLPSFAASSTSAS